LGAARRIIFDVSMARGGGGFTYAVNVIPLLARRQPTTDFLVVLRNPHIADALPALDNVSFEILPDAGFVDRLRFLAWTAPRLARHWRADLYYSASELSPFTCPCPRIAAFRNANLFTPLQLGWPLGQRARMAVLAALARRSARTCDRILFVSDDSARWIGDSVGLPPSRRATVPHGIDLARWSAADDSPPLDAEFILSVSSIYRYKNFVRLIEAWRELAERWPEVPDLVIAGDDQDPVHSQQMLEARASAGRQASRIHIVGEVPYSEIARYYRHAMAFVFPSYLETFGHPLLEAMAAGLPVLASDLGVFREVGGEAVAYFDPHDTSAMSDALEKVLRDPERQRAMVSKGFERVEQYSWTHTANGLMRLFEEVLQESDR
jgi:glycosyltransferase involved in cell wall biosynthesis